MSVRSVRTGAVVTAAVVAAPIGAASAQVEVVIAEGQAAPGTPGLLVTALGAPFTDGPGRAGFTGTVDDKGGADRFVWYDAGVVWRNRDALPTVLTGAESTMGISDVGGFIYSPATDGDDSVWTDAGLLLKETDPAPDFDGQFVTFCSRPTMIPGGTAYFVSGLNPVKGGSTQARVLYRADGGVITKVVASGDEIGGFIVAAPSGVGFDYHVSDDGSHRIQELLMETGSSANDGFVVVDDAPVAREGDPVDGEAWQNFDIVSINDDGHYIFTGDTNGPTSADEFIAYDGSIVVREGMTVGCIELVGGALRAASINDDGVVVHVWGVTGGHEVLFVGQGSDLAATSRVALQLGDRVDVDGDGADDAVVVDFNASAVVGPGVDLAEDGAVHVEVDLVPLVAGGEFEAILRVTLPDPDCLADVDTSGVVDTEDLLAVLSGWGACAGCRADIDGDCMIATSDLLEVLAAWGRCP
jgi:hypothetical protein